MDRPRCRVAWLCLRGDPRGRRFVRRLLGGCRIAPGEVPGDPRHRLRPQLRQVGSPVLRFRRSRRRGRHHDGCRPAGFARRDSRTAPHDPRRRVRPGIRLEEEAPRPGRQTLAEQILQLDGAPGLRHQTPRFQLRAEGLPPQGCQVDRGLRRDAPFHSDSGEAGRGSAVSAKRSSSTTPANTAARSSASNVP